MTPLLLAANDLRQRLRDRSFFIFGLLLPFGLAFVFSLLFAPFDDASPQTADVVLVDEDDGQASAGLRLALSGAEQAGVVVWREAASQEVARTMVAAGEVDAAIVVPDGFGAAAVAGEASEIVVLGDPDRRLAVQIAEGVARAFQSRLRGAVWAAGALADAGTPLPTPLVLLQATTAPDPLVVAARPTSDRQLDLVTYYAAGMAAFFVFFTVQLGVSGILDEERDGTLQRLLAAPVGRGKVLLGKVLSSVIIGVLSLVVLAVASQLVMGADWGDPLGAFVLIVALVLAASGIVTIVAGIARSPEAAGNVQSVVAITLGALGGSFFQLPDSGGVLSALRSLTPHYWFLRGVGDLSAGGGVPVLGEEVLAMLAFGLVTGAVGWVLLRRRLTR